MLADLHKGRQDTHIASRHILEKALAVAVDETAPVIAFIM